MEAGGGGEIKINSFFLNLMAVEGWVGRQLEYAVFFSDSCYAATECFHSHEIQQGARSIRTAARMEARNTG